ncbi:MAG: ATPase [Paludibacteraceae bacterium]|nr:ATPase [Paludibacteraceae bacterium]
MILIADSGSTKTHWTLMTASGHSQDYSTDGINPFFLSTEQVENILEYQLLPQLSKQLWAGTITRIFFYGAGCTPEKSKVVSDALTHSGLAMSGNFRADVQSDMLGAARGLLQHEQGIACILGTGSNSALYDGNGIVRQVPALGFILGDEGSGSVLGRQLVSDILKNQLPKDLQDAFFQQYQLTQADIIERVYRQPLPNRFLASFSPFCQEHKDHPAIQDLLYRHFQLFVTRILLQYYKSEEEKTDMPVGFVGSIAYYYQDILNQVLNDNHLRLGQILQDPIEGLRQYHLPDLEPTT